MQNIIVNLKNHSWLICIWWKGKDKVNPTFDPIKLWTNLPVSWKCLRLFWYKVDEDKSYLTVSETNVHGVT
jgi:hypothetical protein